MTILDYDVFCTLPMEFRQTLLDLLFLVMKGNVYNIIRFQCTGDGHGSIESFALNPLLINLLEKAITYSMHTSILKRLINLIGIVGTAGMSSTDLKAYLNILRVPSELTVSLLQSLKIMLCQDHITSEVRVKKASPAAIFDFGGSGAGLTTHMTTFPFSREYQFCTWFRVENFEASRDFASQGFQQRAFNPNDRYTQHIVSWTNSSQKGMDIFIDQRALSIAISNSSNKDPVRLADCQLQRGVWYHITVRHTKPRLSLFSSDELSIFIEDQLVYQENVRFPSMGSTADMQFSFGTNLDGQMAPIYLFSECLPQGVIKMVAGLDAGRPVEGIDNGFNPPVNDLLPSITSADRKVHTVLPKMTMSYHPTRCLRGHALDIHSGRHAKFGVNTQAWLITNARDLLNSMGGLSCILPLFPRLLIENETYRAAATIQSSLQNSPNGKADSSVHLHSPSPKVGTTSFSFNINASTDDSLVNPLTGANVAGPTGLGDTLADLHEESLLVERDLDHAVVRLLREEREEYLNEGCVGLLLSIIAKCVVGHRLHQLELIRVGGIEMIEYALTCTPQEIMQGESEKCVFSLRELQKSASDQPTLERRITKSLLCNFGIWHRASFQLVSSLMSVILEAIKVRPALFVSLMGVKPVLDSLEFFTTVDENADYFLFDGNDIKSPPSHSNSMEFGKESAAATATITETATAAGTAETTETSAAADSLIVSKESNGESNVEKEEDRAPPSLTIETPAHAEAGNGSVGKGKEESPQQQDGKPDRVALARSLAERRSSRTARSSVTGSSLSLTAVPEDEITDFSEPNTSRSSVMFAGFEDTDKVITPTSVNRSGKKLLKMKRMKSFKLTLTEVIQDRAEDEEGVDSEGKSTSASVRRGSLRMRRQSIDSILEEGASAEPTSGSITPVTPLAGPRESGSSKQQSSSQCQSHQVSAYTIDGGIESVMAVDGIEDGRSTAGSEYTISNPFTAAPQSPEQRKHLRDCLEAMVVALVLHGGSDKEISPILDYMVMCKDRVVLNEIAQILLYLIVERGPKFMLTIINACNGPEEFASFVLLYLVHQPYEELRCTGIRILTHFYLRVDQIPPSVINISLKPRRKGSIITRAMPLGSSNSHGLQRLQTCGGLALLCEVVSSHSKTSSELTYSALLELLLTKPGAKCQVTVQYTDLFELSGVPSTTSTATAATVSAAPAPFKGRNSGAIGAPGSTGRQRSVVFAADYLSPDQVHDEAVDMMNSVALPIFFELLPKLPVRVQGQIYGDLLALLKHSEGNCHAFVSSSSWQLCMFGLVSQLVALSDNNTGGKVINTFSLVSELERWTGYANVDLPFNSATGVKTKRRVSSASQQGELLRAWRTSTGHMVNNSSYSYQSDYARSSRPTSMSISSAMATTISNAAASANATTAAAAVVAAAALPSAADSEYDLWFALGMKIYATLLLHAIEFKNGWREIDRSISQSYESDTGYSVAQTVLSHVLNELTFSMRSKYKELQRLAKSNNISENQEATDKIENFLCLILTTSQLALVDQRCAIKGIKNFHLCKLRVHYFTEISKDYVNKKDGTGSDHSKGGDSAGVADIPPCEIRHLLERTEQQLATKLKLIGDQRIDSTFRFDAEGASVRPLVNEGEEEDEDGDHYHKHLNFVHSWHDICDEPPVSTDPAGVTSPGPSITASPSSNPSPFKSIEELLHPLERSHDLAKGKLVLVLQALRFFDIIFWPADSAVIRNAEMMRFNKEDKASSGEGISSQVGGGFSVKHGAADQAKRKTGSQSYPMSMFSAVMRMSLFILSELSPVTHLAVLNVKRLRMLVNSVDKVPQYKTPTHDWLLAALLHTTLNVQRLTLALEPVYEMLGITDAVLVPTLGPWTDSYDDSDRMDSKDLNIFDAVAENPELLNRLQRYFDSSPGRNLIRNIRASLLLLADAFELHHEKLNATLEERTFRSLWVFVEHFKVDSLIQDPGRQASVEMNGRTASVEAFRSGSVDIPGSAARSSSTVSADVVGDIFEAPINSPKRSKSSSFSATRYNRHRSNSADGSGDDVSDISGMNSESGSTQGDRSQSRNTTPVPMEAGEDSFHGSDLLLVLKWLRFPYFRLNPFRSLGVIRSVDALDYLEGRSVNRFAKETQVMKEALEEQRDLAVKSVEEMTELKELSLAVYEMMSNRNDGRVASQESSENLKLKNIAARWHDCIQTFEEDWSPWRIDEGSTTGEIGCAHYELSKHRDFYLRRMATTKMSQPTNHRDAAYLEGKIKDQSAFERSMDVTVSGVDLPATHNSTNASAGARGGSGLLPFKSRAANDKNASSWGDDDEDAMVEEATSANSIAGGIATLLYWNEKRPHWTYMFHWASDERLMFESEAMQIKLDQTVAGM